MAERCRKARGAPFACRDGVLYVRLLAIVLFCAGPMPVAGQPWADADTAGHYERAADLLHEIVIDSALRHAMDDPGPARRLAVLYARGLGVERDPIAACTLAQFADMSAQNVVPPDGLPDPRKAYQLMVQENERFVSDHCALLTDDERRTATSAMGCFAFGMPEQELVVGRQMVRIGRRGLSLVDLDDATSVTDLFGCPVAIAGVRVRSLEPPPDAAPGVTVRHFVEVFGWLRNLQPRGDQPPYTLVWTSHEIRTNAIMPVSFEPLGSADRWPRPGLPADLEARLSLQMIRSGHVGWIIAGDPPRRGWIMVPEEAGR